MEIANQQPVEFDINAFGEYVKANPYNQPDWDMQLYSGFNPSTTPYTYDGFYNVMATGFANGSYNSTPEE
jgi:hypothetical protein